MSVYFNRIIMLHYVNGRDVGIDFDPNDKSASGSPRMLTRYAAKSLTGAKCMSQKQVVSGLDLGKLYSPDSGDEEMGSMAMDDQDAVNAALKDALERCANGENEAFKIIYDLTSAKFTAIIFNMTGCENTAKDVLQKAYLSIWKNASKYDPEKAKPFTWMLVIMRNRSIDMLRSRARQTVTETLEDTLVDDAPSPQTVAQFSQLRTTLEDQLKNLPVHISQVICLHIIEGYTCKEIGLQLGESPNTVKSWIRRGLERLRHNMPYGELSAAI